MANKKDTRVRRQALDGKRLNAFAMSASALTIVGLDTDDGPEHPLYDERIKLPLDEALVRNIRRYGVLETVLVRKNGPLVEVVDGRQRVRCARVASERLVADGFEPVLVPVMVRRDGPADALGVMVSTNEQRRGDDPLTRAKKAQRMLDYGKTEEDVAVAFGVSTGAVRQLLTLLELSPKVQKAVEEQRLSFSAATTLSDLTHKDQDAKLGELVEAGVGVAEARRQRKARQNGKSNGATRAKRVSVKTLRRVGDSEKFVKGLSDDAQYLLQWILGDEACAEHVPGLLDLLTEPVPEKHK